MQNDETIWGCLNNHFCSFKVKTKQPPTTFCRNKYNVSGLCNRVSCPLANSEYATIMDIEGVCYLHMKTVERAHTPKHLWEKVKLPKNFADALEKIDTALEYWPEHKKNRCKQRLTKLRQMLIRSRRLEMKVQPKLVAVKHKTEKREMLRELKAEKAASVDLAVERELLKRLQEGTYGDIYNFDSEAFGKMLEEGEEEELGDESESEEDDDGEFIAESDDDSEEEEVVVPTKKRRRMEIEYEPELATR